MRATTLLSVARAAGVSQSAVSRAFTPGASIAPSTRARVLAAARELGYVPRALHRESADLPQTIAVVMADITNPFAPEVLDALVPRLRRRGLVPEIHCVPRGSDLDSILPELFRHRPAGVLVGSTTLSSHMVPICREHALPVVLLNRTAPGLGVNMVGCDNYAGGFQVAELLVRSGCRRIAFLAGRSDIASNAERQRGLREGLALHGHAIWAQEVGDFIYDRAVEASRRLLARDEPPDAIFCANDIMALAAIDVVVREARLRVPEDVSIVGFDDIAMAAWPAYQLTTIHQRVDVMTEEAIDLLQRLIADPFSAGTSRLIAGILVERATTRSVTAQTASLLNEAHP